MDAYIEPRVSDYGTLEELTATVYPLAGTVGSADLTFSSAQAGTPGGASPGAGSESPQLQPTGATGGDPTAGGGGATGVVGGATDEGGVRGGEATGGTSGSGGAGAGDPGGADGGGSLPFTGYAAGAVALAGAGLAAAGRVLRRATSRRF